jgi:hypothetical protein
MSSPYYSLVPARQKPYATPWYQRTYVNNPLSIEEELENAITQLISENDLSSVPSGDAIYKYLYQRLLHTVESNNPNFFTETNTFIKPIVSTTDVDFKDTESTNLIPNIGSVKEYVAQLLSGEIPDLTNYVHSLINAAVTDNFTYVSTTENSTHIITHNLNSTYLIYSVFIFDPVTGSFKNDLASILEIDANTLIIELESPQIIKVVINRIIPGADTGFTYTSSVAARSHMLAHNLNSEFIYFNIMVYDNNLQLYRNDLVSVIEVDSNVILVDTLQPVNIKAAITIK